MWNFNFNDSYYNNNSMTLSAFHVDTHVHSSFAEITNRKLHASLFKWNIGFYRHNFSIHQTHSFSVIKLLHSDTFYLFHEGLFIISFPHSFEISTILLCLPVERAHALTVVVPPFCLEVYCVCCMQIAKVP